MLIVEQKARTSIADNRAASDAWDDLLCMTFLLVVVDENEITKISQLSEKCKQLTFFYNRILVIIYFLTQQGFYPLRGLIKTFRGGVSKWNDG